MLFFKSKAERLMAAMGKAMKGPGSSMEKLQGYHDLSEEAKAWGAERPEEFVVLLDEENKFGIGKYMAGSGARGVNLLRELILGDDLEKALVALQALWEFEAAAASEVQLLTELLSHADARMRSYAAQCLGRIGPEALSAGPELARLAQEGSDDEKTTAFYALSQTG